VAGGLPSTSVSGGFTAFGRQSTNPQWQYPSLLDPKVSFSWVKGKHSFKFGYEYEHIWMQVQDSNPLFGSFTYGKGYSACPAALTACSSGSAVADTYWSDLIFRHHQQLRAGDLLPRAPAANHGYWYAQDDWKVSPKLTLNLGLRWEYGSPYSEANNNLSNFDPATVSMLTLTPGYTAEPVHLALQRRRRVRKDPGQSRARRLCAARRLRFALTPTIAIRGGYGTSYVHYTRAGSGDILPINAPSALFVSVTQPGTRHGQAIAPWTRAIRRGWAPTSAGHRQHHLRPGEHQGQLRGELLPERAESAREEHHARHRVYREPWAQAAGLPECEPGQSFAGRGNPTTPATGRWLCAAVSHLGRLPDREHELYLRRYHGGAERLLVALQRPAGAV
jgi:hypothetical protein